jgi:hypothetical protein
MKKYIFLCLGIMAFIECYGQKYEVWVKTTGNDIIGRKTLGYFNDSVMTVKSNPSLFNLYDPKDLNLSWNEIEALKVRNRSRHQAGMLIGTGVGVIAVLIFNSSYPQRSGDFVGPVLFDIPILAAGVLAGHLVTSAKIVIPLNGKSPEDKSRALKSRITKQPLPY